jgi:glycosyltransferase involved in cell wall biosynthesis
MSRAAPKVSVIMAVYNCARYVGQAIDSILGQTFTDFEFVIINDGSTDKTADILASYDDSRLMILENDRNIGLTKSLNRGIDVSRGELIARQDADDISLPERLARQVTYMDAHPEIALVGSASRWIDAEGATIREWRPLTEPVEIHRRLLSTIPFLHGTFMFRRSCLAEIGGGYDESMPVAQDCELLLRLSDRWDLANLSDILYLHRRHNKTVTHRRREDQVRHLEMVQEIALQRRLRYGWGRLGISKGNVPDWVRSAERKWLARRYVWWSASARPHGSGAALSFLVIALLLDPTVLDIWKYIAGILMRKTGMSN